MAVTVEDIAIELGRTSPDPGSLEFQQWTRWIGDALMLVEARLGDPAELDQDRLDYVVRQAVAAHVAKPDDATQVSVSVDDGSESRTYASGAGRVTILDKWWDLLSPAGAKGKAFAVDTVGPQTLSAHLPWCDLSFGGADCSCGVNLAGFPIYELR